MSDNTKPPDDGNVVVLRPVGSPQEEAEHRRLAKSNEFVAQQARARQQMLEYERARADLPHTISLMSINAHATRQHFEMLVAAGFREDQAIDLLRR